MNNQINGAVIILIGLVVMAFFSGYYIAEKEKINDINEYILTYMEENDCKFQEKGGEYGFGNINFTLS